MSMRVLTNIEVQGCVGVCVCPFILTDCCWMDCVQPTLGAKQRRVVYPSPLYRHSNAAQ